MKNDRFRKEADLLLGSLTWTQANQNRVLSELRGEPQKMKRKMSLGLGLAIVLMLLATMALAAGLIFSPRYTTLQTARNTVMEKYGLDSHMLRLYFEQVKETNSTTTVIYKGSNTEFLQAKPMGVYTVVVDATGHACATWTYDGTDTAKLQSGDLSSDVWGPVQLQMVIDRYAYYQQWQQETPYLSLLPIAEQAKRVAELDKAIAPCKVAMFRTDVPDETDLTEDEAFALATKALYDNYGVTLTDEWDVERHFQAESSDGRRFVFSFHKGGEEYAREIECHPISVKSPSGEIVLGDNELTSFIAPDATESAAPIPTPIGAMQEEKALIAAKQELVEKYHLDDEMLTLFVVKPEIGVNNGKTIWKVAYFPVDYENYYEEDSKLNPSIDWRWIGKLTKKLGTYEVNLDAQSGEVLSVSWSLDGEQGVYTQNDWATAKAYDASIIPWILQLLTQNKSIADRYGDEQTDWFTVEDAAAYDQAFRNVGFDESEYNHSLPKTSDITAEQAKQIACQAMSSEFGMTQKDFEDSHILCEYVLDNGGEWHIGFYTSLGMGGVDIEAATGEIREVRLDAGESSNG